MEWEPRKALVDKLNKKQREQAAKRGPRKDHNLKHVIINEKRDKKVSLDTISLNAIDSASPAMASCGRQASSLPYQAASRRS